MDPIRVQLWAERVGDLPRLCKANCLLISHDCATIWRWSLQHCSPTFLFLICRFIIIIMINITKMNTNSLAVHSTLASRHQQICEAAEPNQIVAPQRKSVGIKTKMLEHPRSSISTNRQLSKSLKNLKASCWLDRETPPQSGRIHPVMRVQHTWPPCYMPPIRLQCLPREMKLPLLL